MLTFSAPPNAFESPVAAHDVTTVSRRLYFQRGNLNVNRLFCGLWAHDFSTVRCNRWLFTVRGIEGYQNLFFVLLSQRGRGSTERVVWVVRFRGVYLQSVVSKTKKSWWRDQTRPDQLFLLCLEDKLARGFPGLMHHPNDYGIFSGQLAYNLLLTTNMFTERQ